MHACILDRRDGTQQVILKVYVIEDFGNLDYVHFW
jgi:hypothetical protein